MGNHSVGRTMAKAAKVFWKINGNAPVNLKKALVILDLSAEDFHGSDAEFDDELSEITPLSRLVIIAFETPEEEIESLKGPDKDIMLWFDGTYQKFRKRYNFC